MSRYFLYEEKGLSREARAARRQAFFSESLTSFLTEASRGGGPDRAAALAVLREGGEPAVRYNSAGKPYFSDPGLTGIYFSVSDTAGLRAVEFAREEIGLDAENAAARGLDKARMRRLADRCFTKAEREWLWEAGECPRTLSESLSENGFAPGTPDRFFWLWTRKEAYVKFTGRGIAQGLNTFSVLDDAPARIETGRADGYKDIIVSSCRMLCAGNGDGSCGASRLREPQEPSPLPAQEVFL
ncbi:MAG: 4'-phosphopantetheinyl transferase superfamily protein [Clostridiales bacterium]|nr:4'-phosphopantetheinyl transferase superfamily protein [Clostridiales bacterium]